jgi:hypothetical protein
VSEGGERHPLLECNDAPSLLITVTWSLFYKLFFFLLFLSFYRSFQRESQALCLEALTALAEAELRRRHKRRREEEREAEEEARARREALARDREEAKQRREQHEWLRQQEQRSKNEHEWRRLEHEVWEEKTTETAEGPSRDEVIGYMRYLTSLVTYKIFNYQGASDARIKEVKGSDPAWLYLEVTGFDDTMYYFLLDYLHREKYTIDHANRRICFRAPLVDERYTAYCAGWAAGGKSDGRQVLLQLRVTYWLNWTRSLTMAGAEVSLLSLYLRAKVKK